MFKKLLISNNAYKINVWAMNAYKLNTKSAEYVVSLARKQNMGFGNCQKTEGYEDS